VFITATPEAVGPAEEQAEVLFSSVAAVLRQQGARPLQERVFGSEEALPQAADVRASVYGDLDDRVGPTLLAVPEGPLGPLAGVQVHAVRGAEAPAVLTESAKPCGRLVQTDRAGYVALSGLTAPEAGGKEAQARAVFEKAANLLRRVGAGMQAVVRTWLWLGDILSWYDAFNAVRTEFFMGCGLIDAEGRRAQLPASTGIGVGPAGEAVCALDAIALVGQGASVSYYHAAGMQQCAYEYGSAFSRVAKAVTPGGTTVYVSGTAAIDDAGATQHVGDGRGQIEMTLENVRAALSDIACTDADVVHAIAYSKTPRIQALFDRDFAAHMSWPCVSVIGDVCRDDLLFEIEATACPGARPV